MSYDIYCYRSDSGIPNVEEARSLIEKFNADEEAGLTSATNSDVKQKIVDALMQHNPRLERFRFDYEEIAKIDNISMQEAQAKYQHIELNPPEGDLAIQLVVYNDHVFVTMPYWYTGDDADRLFSSLSEYLRVIRNTAGFFAYDPQTDKVSDPAQTRIEDHTVYEKVTKRMPNVAAKIGRQGNPWWKFW
jgi:hypothetical protein